VTQPNDEGFTVFFLLMRCSMYSLTISTWIVAVMMCVCWSYSKWIYPLSLIIFFFFVFCLFPIHRRVSANISSSLIVFLFSFDFFPSTVFTFSRAYYRSSRQHNTNRRLSTNSDLLNSKREREKEKRVK
jgi:uncharacterized membrane protein